MIESLRIEHPSAHDVPFLKKLWETTFGDPPELIDAFFECFSPIKFGWIARLNGEIVSSAYLLSGNTYQKKDASLPAYYVYAVATPKAYRGHGYAGALMQHFHSIAAKQDALLYTRPASDSLFQWYASVMQTVPSEPLECRNLPAEREFNFDGNIHKITAEAYAERREVLLRNTQHIQMSLSFLSLQERYLEAENGGFYEIGSAVCALEQHEDTIVIKELLTGDEPADLTAKHIAATLGAKRAQLWTRRNGGAPHVAYYSSFPVKDLCWGLLLD